MPHHFFVCSPYDGVLLLGVVGQAKFMINLQKTQQLAYYAINKLCGAAVRSNCHRSPISADVVCCVEDQNRLGKIGFLMLEIRGCEV